jgi:hypothetical protein
MVTLNVVTDLDLANGSKGMITAITLDPRERPTLEDGVVLLDYPPAMVLFKPDQPTRHNFEGLPQGE